ncbi:MAG: hypothetical protein V8T37_02140 [Streptococcus sp.]
MRRTFGRGATLQRYKGLGEMNADQLWETTMNPETRTLIRVTIDDLARAERRVSVLMGDKAAPRRQWIEDNVKFTTWKKNGILSLLSTYKSKISCWLVPSINV